MFTYKWIFRCLHLGRVAHITSYIHVVFCKRSAFFDLQYFNVRLWWWLRGAAKN